VAHVARHTLAGKDARRERGCADGALHLEHVTVCLGAAAEAMTTNNAGKATSLGGADHIDKLLVGEDIDHDAIASLHCAFVTLFCGFDRNFLEHLDRRHVRFGEVTSHGLIHLGGLDEVDITDLCSIVAVFRQGLELRDHTGASLEHGHRVHIAAVVEHLGHADLLTENSCNCHLCFLSSSCRGQGDGTAGVAE
jgi:hypothetical protein